MDILLFIAGLGFSISGLFGLFGLWAQWDILHVQKRWPFVKGTIQTSILKTEVKDDNGKPILLHHPEILYRYQVKERKYTARESFHRLAEYQQTPEELVSAYPEGKQLNVFYNPKNPQESTLKTSYKIPWSTYFVVFLVLLALSVLCFWMVFTSR